VVKIIKKIKEKNIEVNLVNPLTPTTMSNDNSKERKVREKKYKDQFQKNQILKKKLKLNQLYRT
jgi:hypothetical protein